MPYDAASFKAGFALGRMLWRPPTVEKPEPPAHCLTFKSEDSSEFTLSASARRKRWDGALYYSTDGITWTMWDATAAVSSAGGVLYLRGSNNTRISSFDNHFELTSGKRIQCVGNIENLLDWETVAEQQHPQMASSCFGALFRECDSLTKAPELPATELVSYCYDYMFDSCIQLTEAPKLPATALASGCYYLMFYNCTSLAKAPELPATTLADSCYGLMFEYCTSLTEPPALPATTLETYCYNGMFYGCTSLSSLPELPATELKASCYVTMFGGCSSIILSTAQNTTFQYPFRIPTTGTGTTADSALARMFYGTGGPFTGTPSINTTYYTDHPPVPAVRGGGS